MRPPELETFAGGCHCGAVRFEVDLERLEAVECNCSICTKKGYLHLIVPKERFRLLAGAEALATYTFNTHVAKHHFCRSCGMHAFYVPRSHPDGFSANLRCLDGAPLARFTIRAFDGARWEEAVEGLRG